MKVMIDRDQVNCTSVLGLTNWAKKIEGDPGELEMFVDNKCNFKLGEIINVVAFYYPENKKLYFVRRATEEEIEKNQLNGLENISKVEVDYEKIR